MTRSNKGSSEGGPSRMDHAQRLVIAQQISDQLQHHYQDQVKAIGIFGSVAREMDEPFSDIELHCVLQGENIETAYEWATETWKGLVNVYSQDIMLRDAAIIDETWPFVQSGYVFIKPLYDPDGFFSRIREIALKPRPDEFDQAVQNRSSETSTNSLSKFVTRTRQTRPLRSRCWLSSLQSREQALSVLRTSIFIRHTRKCSRNLWRSTTGRPDTMRSASRSYRVNSKTRAGSQIRRIDSGKESSPGRRGTIFRSAPRWMSI